MNTILKPLVSDRILLFSFILSCGMMLFSLGIIAFFYSKLPPFIPLFNQMPWGVARLGTKEQIFIPLFIASIVLLTNTILANYIYGKMPLIARILCVTSLLVSLFVFLFIIRTVQIIV